MSQPLIRATFALFFAAASAIAMADGNMTYASRKAAQPSQVEPLTLPATRQVTQRPTANRLDDEPLCLDETESDDGSSRRLTEDDVAARQSVDAFNTLEDGQPGNPGTVELKLETGWLTTSGQHDNIEWLTELQINPDGGEFWRNSQFTIGVPVELGLGGVDGNADVLLGWQQRWVAEDGAMPTLATLTEVRLPTGYDSSGIDATITGVVAKDLGPGTAYANAFARTANGNNIEDLRHFQWGFRAGYKWRIQDDFALIGDYVHQTSEQTGVGDSNTLELSGEWHVNEHLTIGPGIVIGLDDNDETPDFGAGIRFMIGF